MHDTFTAYVLIIFLPIQVPQVHLDSVVLLAAVVVLESSVPLDQMVRLEVLEQLEQQVKEAPLEQQVHLDTQVARVQQVESDGQVPLDLLGTLARGDQPAPLASGDPLGQVDPLEQRVLPEAAVRWEQQEQQDFKVRQAHQGYRVRGEQRGSRDSLDSRDHPDALVPQGRLDGPDPMASLAFLVPRALKEHQVSGDSPEPQVSDIQNV